MSIALNNRVVELERRVKDLEARLLQAEGHENHCAVFSIPPLPISACDCRARRKIKRLNDA